LGTLGMKERAMLLGGELKVESGFGNGTAIEIRLPVENLAS
jgi:signal transduction histidine kinase